MKKNTTTGRRVIERRFMPRRCITILLSVLILVASAGMGATPGHGAQTPPPALVRVNSLDADTSEMLELWGSSVYARLFDRQGEAYLLLPANTTQQAEIIRKGYKLQILDPDASQANYYLLYGLEADLINAFDDSRSTARILLIEGRQAVARATPDEAEILSANGIDVKPLRLHRVVPPLFSRDSNLPDVTSPNPLIQGMVDQVNSATLETYVGNLSGEWSVTVKGSPYTFATRYSMEYKPITKATRFAYEHFQGLNLPYFYHYYYLYGLERRNVLAEQTGLTQPERIFLLTAHLDSYSQNPTVLAPGADDNASGAAALMLIADILSQYQFGCTLRYILFTGEEQGMHGSAAYADLVYQSGDGIEAVLNLDMLAYNTPGTAATIELHTRPQNVGDLAIANLFASVIPTYQVGLTPIIQLDGLAFSDHSSFWDHGYPALLAEEDWNDHTPYYHTTGDQLENINLAYYTEFVKASLATFAHMGCLLQGSLGGVVRDASTSDPIAGAVVEVISESGDTLQMNTQADGSYQFPLLFPGNYSVEASDPSYYSNRVEAVVVAPDQTTEINFSLPLINNQVFMPLIITE